MINILLGECSTIKGSKPFLISVVEDSKTTSENINAAILEKFHQFFENDLSRLQHIKLLLTDAAPYAIKAGKMLKCIIPKLYHLTCVCHALHNLSETIRDTNQNVDKIITFLKRSLVKNKENQRFLKK